MRWALAAVLALALGQEACDFNLRGSRVDAEAQEATTS